jgi:hypothetical protein
MPFRDAVNLAFLDRPAASLQQQKQQWPASKKLRLQWSMAAAVEMAAAAAAVKRQQRQQ